MHSALSQKTSFEHDGGWTAADENCEVKGMLDEAPSARQTYTVSVHPVKRCYSRPEPPKKHPGRCVRICRGPEHLCARLLTGSHPSKSSGLALLLDHRRYSRWVRS